MPEAGFGAAGIPLGEGLERAGAIHLRRVSCFGCAPCLASGLLLTTLARRDSMRSRTQVRTTYHSGEAAAALTHRYANRAGGPRRVRFAQARAVPPTAIEEGA